GQQEVRRQDGRMALTVPVARGANGPISGPVLCEWRPNTRVDSLPMADRYHIAQPTADVDYPAARLTVRADSGAPAVAIARGAWRVSGAAAGAAGGGLGPGEEFEARAPAAEPPPVGGGVSAGGR